MILLSQGSAHISINKNQVLFSPTFLKHAQKGKCILSSSNAISWEIRSIKKKPWDQIPACQEMWHFLFPSGLKWAQLKWATHEHTHSLPVWTKCPVWGQQPPPTRVSSSRDTRAIHLQPPIHPILRTICLGPGLLGNITFLLEIQLFPRCSTLREMKWCSPIC